VYKTALLLVEESVAFYLKFLLSLPFTHSCFFFLLSAGLLSKTTRQTSRILIHVLESLSLFISSISSLSTHANDTFTLTAHSLYTCMSFLSQGTIQTTMQLLFLHDIFLHATNSASTTASSPSHPYAKKSLAAAHWQLPRLPSWSTSQYL
jgi:hypothetical protein